MKTHLRIGMALFLISLLCVSSHGVAAAFGQDDKSPVATPAAKTQDDFAQAMKAQCKFNDNETDLHELERQNKCMRTAIQVNRERVQLQGAISRAAAIRANQANPKTAPAQGKIKAALPPGAGGGGSTPTGDLAGANSPMVGGSLSGTPSTCGPGSGSNNPTLIRVHRTVLTPKTAADDFGYRLGRRFIVYQVTVENYSKDYQYMLEDVTIDFSNAMGATAGTYEYNASSQDLSLLRGVPEKGADLDPRNAALHILQGIGSVAGGITGLTSFGDVMGPAVAVFNGSFIQGYTTLAPDHAANQLNRLSDSAFSANTVIDKQRAKTIAMFIPADEVLSKEEQKAYWKDPNSFVSLQDQGAVLNAADVCVDGTFIQAVTVTAPTLSTAVLGNIVMPLPGAATSLKITGANLVEGDTQLIIGSGANSKFMVATPDGKNGTAQITLPPDYTSDTTAVLQSVTNPTLTSGAGVKLTAFTLVSPTLTAAVPSAVPTGNGKVDLTLTGTNLVKGDTQIVVGAEKPPLVFAVDTTNGQTGKVKSITLPADYTADTTVMLQSLSKPTLTSGAGVKLTGYTPPAPAPAKGGPVVAPTLTKAVSSAAPKAGGIVDLTLTGTNIVQGDTQVVVGTGKTAMTAPVDTTDGKIGTAKKFKLPTDYKAATQVVLKSKLDTSKVSASVSLTTGP